MYFDHVRCPSCGASFDPERVEMREGVMSCPSCKSQLGLKSLFGLRDAFEEMEEEKMTIDDLVPGGSANRTPEGAKPSGHPQLTALDVLKEKRKD